jgi:hypothetical protein
MDSRQYQENEPTNNLSIDPAKPVTAIKENETGRNEYFFDWSKGFIMDRESFVSNILAGMYPGYEVKSINNLQTPVSVADSNKENNLG